MNLFEFTYEECDALFHLANLKFHTSTHQDAFCEEIKRLSKLVPHRVKQEFDTFMKSSSVLCCKLPTFIENVSTPPTNKYHIGETTRLSVIQAILIHLIGDMISYEAEGNGHLFQDIVPDKAMSNQQTSIGSNTELEIHTEQAFSKLKPDIISLACLQGDKDALTYVLPLSSLLEHLTSQEIELLRKPLWYTKVDLSFRLHGLEFKEGDIRGPIAILQDDVLTFDQDLMTGTTLESIEIIPKLIDIYMKHRISHCLQPYEILFIHNQRAVHGRSRFFPRFDGKDRFLIRCFASFDLEKSEYARKETSRMIQAIYS